MEPTDAHERLRQAVPVAERWVYLDHAAVAPLPQPTSAAMALWLEQATRDGNTHWPTWSRGVEETRRLAAELINADPREIALVPSTTFGINLVARGLDWRAGDNVVVPENEFPSNLYPWLSLADQGVETRRVPVVGGQLDIETLLNMCDDRTRLIAVSWVGYVSGWQIPVKQLCEAAHARGLPVLLDAIQGLGLLPLDVRATDVDFVAADGHKWMLGPEGAGIFYVRHDWLARLRPLMVGWNSVEQRYDFHNIAWRPRDEAARYEGGSQNMAGMLGLGASLKLLRECGLTHSASPLATHAREITEYARRCLLEAGATLISPENSNASSGIVTFRWSDVDPLELRRRCNEHSVVLSARGGGLRISPHGYNTRDEIDRLITVLAKVS